MTVHYRFPVVGSKGSYYCCCATLANCCKLPSTLTVTLACSGPAFTTFTCGNGATCENPTCCAYLTGSYVMTGATPLSPCQWGGSGDVTNVPSCQFSDCTTLLQTWTNTLTLTLSQTVGETGPRFHLAVHSGPQNLKTCYQSGVLDCSKLTLPVTLTLTSGSGCLTCGAGITVTASVQT